MVEAVRDWVCPIPSCVSGNVHKRKPLLSRSLLVLPTVLVLQLMRWRSVLRPLMHHVRVERRLVVKGQEFMLRSIVYHSGGSLQGGHYVTCLEFPVGSGKLWLHNDIEKLPVSVEDATNNETWKAYVAIYERV